MKHMPRISPRIAKVAVLSALMSATLLGGASFAGDKGCNKCGSTPNMPHAPQINVGIPKISTHVFNVSVPVPNVHVPMFNGQRHKKDGGTETFREKETIIERETTIIEREVINNQTVYVGGGGGSSYVIMQAPAVELGRIEVAQPQAPKPVKAECIDGKGHLSNAWRVSPAEIDATYRGEVFRCADGFALGATVGEWVNGRADYTDGFVIECMEGEALRFGQSGRLACAAEERRADRGHTQLAGGLLAEVLIHRGTTTGNGRGSHTGAADLGGLVLTGGVGGRVY